MPLAILIHNIPNWSNEFVNEPLYTTLKRITKTFPMETKTNIAAPPRQHFDVAVKPDFCWGTKQTKGHSNKTRRKSSLHAASFTVSNSSKASLNSAFWSSIMEAMMMELVLFRHYRVPTGCPAPRDSSWPELPARVRLSAELLPFFYREIAYLAQAQANPGNACI